MKKLIIAATLAALTVTSAAMAAPLRDPQPGDLKANANYGFDQKEGGRSAKSRLTGGDVTYVLNNHWDIQFLGNSTDSLKEFNWSGDYTTFTLNRLKDNSCWLCDTTFWIL